ncbi:MAG: peptide chain release factor N(5)-glutamine methyltransferase [Actinobacteria bacterium]|nr:peptide chain release factor N(5)-glutamine methyltransferase [Actinomycetota bacterium]
MDEPGARCVRPFEPTRPTWRELLKATAAQLKAHRPGAPACAEARQLVACAAGCERSELFMVLDDRAGTLASEHLAQMASRRASGEPLQYVLGEWGFRNLDLLVDPRVLIPRPETELVVDVAISELASAGLVDQAGRASGPEVTVVDLGTGSGAIALSIASEIPRAAVWATDMSTEALKVASANLAGLGGEAATRVQLLEGSWYEPLPSMLIGKVNLVISNPPYVAEMEWDALPEEVREFEPKGALVSGPSGTEALEEVISSSRPWLADPGVLVVEIAPHHSDLVQSLARRVGFALVRVEPDLSHRPRALVARTQ